MLSLDGIHLDRERVANYLFIVEAQSNSNGATNYTRVMINVLGKASCCDIIIA